MPRHLENIVNEANLLVTKLEDGQLWVRHMVIIDGEKVYQRHVIHPGLDYSNEDPRVRAVAQTIHTPAVVTAYEAAQLLID